MGHNISIEGIKVDRGKIRSISEMPLPKNVKGIMSLAEWINYMLSSVFNLS